VNKRISHSFENKSDASLNLYNFRAIFVRFSGVPVLFADNLTKKQHMYLTTVLLFISGVCDLSLEDDRRIFPLTEFIELP
jgi:hypothetical protein